MVTSYCEQFKECKCQEKKKLNYTKNCNISLDICLKVTVHDKCAEQNY